MCNIVDWWSIGLALACNQECGFLPTEQIVSSDPGEVVCALMPLLPKYNVVTVSQSLGSKRVLQALALRPGP